MSRVSISSISILIAAILLFINNIEATSNQQWAGTSMYYLWACNSTIRNEYLSATTAANLKVLRIFVLASCTSFDFDSCQGYNTCDPIPDVENPVGKFNDKILEHIDRLMLETYQRGIKLDIALHDRWSLGCWRTDAYAKKYGISIVDCQKYAAKNNPDVFYQSPQSHIDFKNRIEHILNHQNSLMGGKAWRDLDEAIFTFQPENEPRYDSNPEWLSIMTATLKNLTKIPISSGGPAGGGRIPEPSKLVKDPNLDILTIHDYEGIIDKLIPEYQQAINSAPGKRYFIEEFGFPGNNVTQQVEQYTTAISYAISPITTPWMFWMLGQGGGQDSLNLFPGDLAFDQVIAPLSLQTSEMTFDQSWPEIWGQ